MPKKPARKRRSKAVRDYTEAGANVNDVADALGDTHPASPWQDLLDFQEPYTVDGNHRVAAARQAIKKH